MPRPYSVKRRFSSVKRRFSSVISASLHPLPQTPFQSFLALVHFWVLFRPPSGRNLQGHFSHFSQFESSFPRFESVFVNHSRFFPRFQSVFVNFSQFQSVFVNFSQLQADHTRQKHRKFLPTGRWGETTPKLLVLGTDLFLTQRGRKSGGHGKQKRKRTYENRSGKASRNVTGSTLPVLSLPATLANPLGSQPSHQGKFLKGLVWIGLLEGICFVVFLSFLLLFLLRGACDCNLLKKWGSLLRFRLHQPPLKLPDHFVIDQPMPRILHLQFSQLCIDVLDSLVCPSLIAFNLGKILSVFRAACQGMQVRG